MKTPILAFCHIQKTAGITVNRILRRSYGMRHCDVEPWSKKGAYYDTAYDTIDHRRLRWLYPYLLSIAGHQVKPHVDLSSLCPNVRYFLFVRDPIARTASHYQFNVQVMKYQMSFDEWCRNEQYRNLQTKHIAGCECADTAIEILRNRVFFVGLLERFDESLVMLQRKHADPRLNIRYESENVATDSSIKQALVGNPETRRQLEELNGEDLRLYEYITTELYPSQQQAHGDTLEQDVETFTAGNRTRRLNFKATLNLIKRTALYKPLLRTYRRLFG